MRGVKSSCPYCGVGCGVLIASDGHRIAAVRGDPAHPANFGRLCTKGATLHLTAGAGGRALYPQVRASRGQARRRVSWDTALDLAASRFSGFIRDHGPDSVAFYISGQLLTEDYYVFNKLAKGLIGTNNIDTNSRLCMSSAVAAYKLTLGADAPPACYEDIDSADCLFIAGSNTAFAHPILFRRIEDARSRNAALKIIVVDPRRTDTAAAADLFLQINPGTDVALFNGMMNVMVAEGWCDEQYIMARTDGFQALARIARDYPPAAVAEICGVSPDDIAKAARWFARSRATLSLYCQGLNQSSSGTDKNAALINLHLAAGQIGRPGAGPFSLTGQPNAMGGREVGGMANLLSAHRDLANPEHRAEIARLWGVESVPGQPGRTAVELFAALGRGEVKAVWIACTNPAHSMPDQRTVRAALDRAEFVVVQEAYEFAETAAHADVLLPAASWGEKEGTMTNSERRITRVHAAVPAPGEARADWEIAADFARRLGARQGRRTTGWLFPYASVEDVFNEHRETTRGRDLDITGLSYALLEAEGPQQWPFPEGAARGRARLYTDGVFATADGRARFAPTVYRPVAEPPDRDYPLQLTTGRLRDQWHSMTRTGSAARLFNHAPEPVAAMNAADLAERGIRDGDIVRVASRRGAVALRVQASPDVAAGQVFVPMHWGSRHLNSAGANALTHGAFDPVSRQPELKHAAVAVEKFILPWQMVVMKRRDPRREGASALTIMQDAQHLLARFDYASIGLCGREEAVVVLRVSNTAPPAREVVEEIDQVFGFDDVSRIITYFDVKRGISKRVLLDGGMIIGARLAGETAAYEWLRDVMIGKGEAPRPWLLAPLAALPDRQTQRGRVVCNCFDVAESEIRVVLDSGADLAALQDTLRCGTECGSCVPELKRMCVGVPSGSRSAGARDDPG